MRRSPEPPLWLLFGAGGLLAALIGPALVAFTGILMPAAAQRGVALLDYETMHALLQAPVARGCAVAVITLMLFHAAHRIYHTLRDLGLRAGRGVRIVCYSGAAAGGLLAVVAVVGL
ncbi:MAG: fumarate reductase subunit FrdD [Halorhodospira sp.]